MTDQHTPAAGGGGEDDATRPRFVDKRRIDPETGQVRQSAPADGASQGAGAPGAGGEGERPAAGDGGQDVVAAAELVAAQALAEERLEDLRRLQAEYVNYRKRVERDRDVARELTVVAVVEAMLGVLDDIDSARQHGDLVEGPFAAIAEKLEATLAKFGWERYGAVGEPFDPAWHEALMHQQSDEVTEPTVVQVLQFGHRVGERVVRAARVAVAGPEG